MIKLLTKRQQFTPKLETIITTQSLFSTCDADTIPTEALMFQASYLTIAKANHLLDKVELQLRYPNQEVETSLNENLLGALCGVSRPRDTQYRRV